MKIVESNVETLHIEKKSNGKVYILSGAVTSATNELFAFLNKLENK